MVTYPQRTMVESHAMLRLPRWLMRVRDALFGLIALAQVAGFVYVASVVASRHCFIFQPNATPGLCSQPGDMLVSTTAYLTSIGLWGLSLVVWAIGYGMPGAIPFFLACQSSVGVLTLGGFPTDQPAVMFVGFVLFTNLASTFLFFSYWSLFAGPAVHDWRRRRFAQACAWAVVCANGGVAVLVISPWGGLGHWIWQLPLRALVAVVPGTCGACAITRMAPSEVARTAAGMYTAFAFSVLVTFVFSSVGYRATHHAATRQRLRLLLLGMAVAFFPVVFLTVIPALLSAERVKIPYGLTFPFLLLYPLSYLYTLIGGRLTRLQPRLSACATYYLSAIVLLGLYLSVAGVLGHLPGVESSGNLMPGALATTFVVLLAFPLHSAVRRVVNWAWADETTDPLQLNATLTERLKLTLDGSELNRHLVTTLPDGLCLTGAALLLPDEAGGWFAASGMGTLAWITGDVPLDGDDVRELVADVADGGPLAGRKAHLAVRAALACLPLERSAYDDEPTFTLPLVLYGALRGILLLGPRRLPDRSGLTSAELWCLATVAYQAAVALHNVELIARNTAAHERFGTEMARRLDRERTRIGDNLHNGPIQEVCALGWLLDEAGSQIAGDASATLLIKRARTMASAVAENLRDLMYSVESPGVVGFGPAIESALDAIRAQHWIQPPSIHSEISPDLPPMPPEVADCLVDIMREAVVNSCRHARASQVRVVAQPHAVPDKANGKGVLFEVVDDGLGFPPHQRAGGSFVREHTGLFRMRRRAAMAGAVLSYESAPGGARVRVCWTPPTAEHKRRRSVET